MKHPTGPVDKLDGRTITLHVAEFCYHSDTKPENISDRVKMKEDKYAELMICLIDAGWNLKFNLIVITAGLRGLIPKRNMEEYQKLGITNKKEQKELQNELHEIAAEYITKIVNIQRSLRRKRSNILKKQQQPTWQTGIG